MDRIERIARALCRANDEDPDATYAEGAPSLWKYRVDEAKAVCAELGGDFLDYERRATGAAENPA